jgi:hypothetical protein
LTVSEGDALELENIMPAATVIGISAENIEGLCIALYNLRMAPG